MSNNSSTGGILVPDDEPAPLEGTDLLDLIQSLIKGITTIPGSMVRPRWQAEPPNIPNEGTVWASFGITSRPTDTFPVIAHDSDEDGSDTFQRYESLIILCSFYDTGVTGQADKYMGYLRDGLMIPQNLEAITTLGFGLVETQEPRTVPVLIKTRWEYRVDIVFVLRREINRVYPVLNIESASGEIDTDTQLSDDTYLHTEFNVVEP